MAPALGSYAAAPAPRAEPSLSLAQAEEIGSLLKLLRSKIRSRLMECCTLRVKDLDFGQNQIVVRCGKGGKDRYTMLPTAAQEPLRKHLEWVKRQHDEDLANGLGSVELPFALARKYLNAPKEWGWQWAFPATSHYEIPETGQRRRHHLYESVLQKAFKEARLKAAIAKLASPHTLRHSFATPAGRRLRHSHGRGKGVVSPADKLLGG